MEKTLKFFLITFVGIGLFVALFPWLFSYQGNFFGRALSIRALGDVVGGMLALFGLYVFISQRTPEFLQRFAIQLETTYQKNLLKVLLLLTAVFAVGAVSHKLRAHAMLSTHAFDLGFFSNICWNTSQGNWFFSSVLERNFLSVHTNWILWPLSYLYHFMPDARCLLIAQVVFMAAAVPILGMTVKRVTDSACVALLAALLFVCSPFFLQPLFNDFHPDTWQIPCLMGALWCYHARRPYYLILFGLTGLLAKEDVSVILGGFSLFLLLQPRWRFSGFLLLIFSGAIFLIQTLVVIPKFIDTAQQSLLTDRYALGHSFSEIIMNFLTRPDLVFHAVIYDPMKYWRFLNYFFPVAGLTFFAPLYLIPCVVSVLPHLLSQAGTQLSLADIYSMPSQPFIFVGAAVGFMVLMKREWFSKRVIRWAGLCFLVAGIGVLNAPRTFRTISEARVAAFREAKQLIPSRASLAAQQNLYSHFDTRPTVQIFPIEVGMPGLQRRVLMNPDYVVCDRIGNALPFDGHQLRQSIVDMEQNAAYEKIFEKENFIVFRRRNTETMRWHLLS